MYDGALCPQRKHRALSTAVTVYCPHHANPHEHRRAPERRHQHQGLHCRLPFRRGVLDLRKLCDVVADVLKGDELAAVRLDRRMAVANLFRDYNSVDSGRLPGGVAHLAHQ